MQSSTERVDQKVHLFVLLKVHRKGKTEPKKLERAVRKIVQGSTDSSSNGFYSSESHTCRVEMHFQTACKKHFQTKFNRTKNNK